MELGSRAGRRNRFGATEEIDGAADWPAPSVGPFLPSGLTPEASLRRGIVHDYEASVRGLTFHIAGHELHHLRTLREKYLTKLV